MKPSNEVRRLHPMTLLQRMVVSLPALGFILLPVIRSGDSTAWFHLVLAGVYAMFIIPWIALYYMRFRYWITPTELVIHSGVITRRKRNIPIERIQNIEIEQSPLPRLLGTAKVAVYTAGSAKAEGVLEYVGVHDAKEIRESLRQMQRMMQEESSEQSDLQDEASHVSEATSEPIFQMSTRRVFTAGAFHFSLLYLAAFFSLLQYIEPDPTVFFSWLLRGPLDPWRASIESSPWLAGILGVLTAAFLGWTSGIFISVNRFHQFRLDLIGNKLHRKHGLLTLAEGTIPLKRVQSLIIRTNPLMKRFDWFRLELQTLGIDLKESGFQVAVPFAHRHEIDAVLELIGGMSIPDQFESVSRITIRRFALRMSIVAAIILLPFHIWVADMTWGLALLPLILALSIARYRNMGFALTETGFVVRKGIFRKHMWLIPTEKMQAFSMDGNYFQRRLGVQNVYFDTAGASPMQPAELVDIPIGRAREIVNDLYTAFSADQLGSKS